MKILLDESLPRKLRYDFGLENEIWSVRDKGWLGKKNGELLRLMKEEQFEMFVTVDRNLPYEQNLQRLPVTIFVLCAFNNRRDTLKKLIPKIFERISQGITTGIIEIY